MKSRIELADRQPHGSRWHAPSRWVSLSPWRRRPIYARSGDVSIAYPVVGEGFRDLVVVAGWIANIDLLWEEPNVARVFEKALGLTMPQSILLRADQLIQ